MIAKIAKACGWMLIIGAVAFGFYTVRKHNGFSNMYQQIVATQKTKDAVDVKLAGLDTAHISANSAPIILTVKNNMTADLAAFGGRAVFTAPDNSVLAVLNVSTSCLVKASTTGFVKTKASGEQVAALSGKQIGDYAFAWEPVEYYYSDGQKLSVQ